jgi:hypothetical protein
LSVGGQYSIFIVIFSAVAVSNSVSEELILHVAVVWSEYASVVTSHLPNQEVVFNKKNTVYSARRKRKNHRPMQRKQYIMSMGSALLSTPS